MQKFGLDQQDHSAASSRCPRKTWKETVEKERTEWKINSIEPLDRGTWRGALHSKGKRRRGAIEHWIVEQPMQNRIVELSIKPSW